MKDWSAENVGKVLVNGKNRSRRYLEYFKHVFRELTRKTVSRMLGKQKRNKTNKTLRGRFGACLNNIDQACSSTCVTVGIKVWQEKCKSNNSHLGTLKTQGPRCKKGEVPDWSCNYPKVLIRSGALFEASLHQPSQGQWIKKKKKQIKHSCKPLNGQWATKQNPAVDQ